MARRVKSLHHNLQEGQNVVFHRYHRSPRNQSPIKKQRLQKFDRKHRRGWKKLTKSYEFMEKIERTRRIRKHFKQSY